MRIKCRMDITEVIWWFRNKICYIKSKLKSSSSGHRNFFERSWFFHDFMAKPRCIALVLKPCHKVLHTILIQTDLEMKSHRKFTVKSWVWFWIKRRFFRNMIGATLTLITVTFKLVKNMPFYFFYCKSIAKDSYKRGYHFFGLQSLSAPFNVSETTMKDFLYKYVRSILWERFCHGWNITRFGWA